MSVAMEERASAEGNADRSINHLIISFILLLPVATCALQRDCILIMSLLVVFVVVLRLTFVVQQALLTVRNMELRPPISMSCFSESN